MLVSLDTVFWGTTMSKKTKEPPKPLVLSGSNLSHLWGRTLWTAIKSPGAELKPILISINEFQKDGLPHEDQAIRQSLDAFLEAEDCWSVEIVGFTIFPERYRRVTDSRQELYEMYFDALPHIKARQPQLNSKGLYFERLTKFGAGKENDNQLEFIISEFLAGRKRTSKFQASIYDPARDQSKQPYQTFPCLQTVSFVPSTDGLVVNGFYAMQYLLQRAYGNLLGLAHLGAFMAGEMKIPLAQVNMITGVEKLEFPKERLASLAKVISAQIPDLVAA